MTRIKAGVIGTGFIGAAHLEALRRTPGVQVTALAEQDLAKAQALARAYGIPTVTARWQDLVDDPQLTAVHNCTPNHLHFRINKALLAAGKHVLSEKPLCLTSRESAELVQLAREHGLVNAVDFNYRGYPLIREARARIAAGELGAITLVHGHYLQDWLLYPTDYNWRLDPELGGASRAVADIGSHWCDLVQYITGLKIRRLLADLVTVHPTRQKPLAQAETFRGPGAGTRKTSPVSISTEDVGLLLIQFENGARGSLTVSQVSPGRKNRLWFEVAGSDQALAWNQEVPNRLWIGHRDRPNELLIKDPALLSETARAVAHYPGGHPEGYPDGLKNIVGGFYDSIRSGKDPRQTFPDLPTFADGHQEVLMVEAVLESRRRQGWIDLT